MSTNENLVIDTSAEGGDAKTVRKTLNDASPESTDKSHSTDATAKSAVEGNNATVTESATVNKSDNEDNNVDNDVNVKVSNEHHAHGNILNANSITPSQSNPNTSNTNKALQIASIYVGDLDPTITEPQLVEVFKPFGTILNVRVCRDIITQRSLGYGYVNFDNHSDAEKAIETLNFKRIGDKCVRLMWQQRDPALRYSGNGNIFVKNLDDGVNSKGLHDLFEKFGLILSCKIMEDEEGKSRGYGFVHFKDEQSAKKAIEKMNGADDHANAEKHALYVANFIRRNARLAALVANFTNVYIKQVLPTVDKEVIEKFFAKFGGITSAAACKDKNGRVFAFCNFEKHDDAVKAIEAMHDKHIEGITGPEEKLYVQRAQPRSERLIALRQKYMQSQSLGNNLYVRNFDLSFTDDNLLELFKEYGEVKSCRVMTDANGVSRGFGFVSFANAEQANAALREMNGRMLNNKPLIVNIAQRRDQRYTMLRMQFQQRLHLMMKQMQQQQQQQQQQHQFQQQQQQQQQQNSQQTQIMPQQGGFAPTALPQRVGRGRGGRAAGAAGTANRLTNFAMPLPMNGSGMLPPITFTQPPAANASTAPLPPHASAGTTTATTMMMMMHPPLPHPMQAPIMSQIPHGAPLPFNHIAPVLTQQIPQTTPVPVAPLQTSQQISPSSSAQSTAPTAPATAAVSAPLTTPIVHSTPTPRLSPGQAPETPPLPPISMQELNTMSREEQRSALGDRLFIKICEIAPEYAPKITGMILEMDYKDAFDLLNDNKELLARVTEALCVLKAHDRPKESELVPEFVI